MARRSRNIPPTAQRATRPTYWSGNLHQTGPSVVPRRGWDELSQRIMDAAADTNIDALKRYYREWPLRLLKIECVKNAYAANAHDNNAALMFSPGDVELEVISTYHDSDGKIVEEVIDDETLLMRAWWKRQAQGLPSFARAMLMQIEYSGMGVVECVPSVGLNGVETLYTVDPLTIIFKENQGKRDMYQRVGGKDETVTSSRYVVTSDGTNDILCDPETVFNVALDSDSDNPYGIPLFSAALPELIRDDIAQQNVSDVMMGMAWPHTKWGFPFEEIYRWAEERPEILTGQREGGGNLTPYEFADREFQNFCDRLKTLRADDPVVGPKGLEGDVLDSGAGIAAIESLLKFQRMRLITGLRQLPNLHGVTDGGTQAYAGEQTRIFSKKLESVRALIFSLVQRVSDLHLRLQGKNYTVRVASQAIMPSDKLKEAQARALEVKTDHDMVLFGWLDNDEASIRHTGSPAVADDISGVQPETSVQPDAGDDPVEEDDTEDGGDNNAGGPSQSAQRMIRPRW